MKIWCDYGAIVELFPGHAHQLAVFADGGCQLSRPWGAFICQFSRIV